MSLPREHRADRPVSVVEPLLDRYGTSERHDADHTLVEGW